MSESRSPSSDQMPAAGSDNKADDLGMRRPIKGSSCVAEAGREKDRGDGWQKMTESHKIDLDTGFRLIACERSRVSTPDGSAFY
jgi:hypothetical protein